MSVIDTSMDMPRDCYVCNKQYCSKRIDIGCRPSDCPLKSIDGLADTIEQFPFTYGFASDIERVINKYCDKENG